MRVLISMSLAVLIWSLYPLAATIGLKSMTSLELILIVYFFSGFGALILAFFYLWKKNLLKATIQIQKTISLRAYVTIIISGIAGVLCHGFFIIALTLANKGGVSLLYESWPVIAVVATPFLMKKTWKEVSLKEFLISMIALIGVAIIILSDKDINIFSSDPKSLTDSMDYTALGGYILAFSGGYMCAVLVVTKGVFAEHFKDLNDDVGTTLVSEVFSRIVSMILMSIIFIFLAQDLNIENIHWGASFFIGFIVFVVGGALYTYGLLKSDRPTVHIIYYFVPVLAVIWLWLVGVTEINAGLFIGGAIVLFANIYLVFAGRKARFSVAS